MLQAVNTSQVVRSAFVAAVLSLLVAGCASNGQKESAAPAPTESADQGISTSGSGSQMNTTPQPVQSQNQGPDLSQHSIYFDFDKSEIKPQYQSVIDNWAKYLNANPSAKVQLQGNTDERGSREYNIALGERRANSVKAALQAEGVSAGQMSVISYGEERPVCTEHDESCWKQNRRTDIVQQ